MINNERIVSERLWDVELSKATFMRAIVLHFTIKTMNKMSFVF